KDYLPRRKFLKLFPKEFRQEFDIGELLEEDSYDTAKQTWHFYYQLHPRNEKVSGIPPLELFYYHQKEYSPSYSDLIPLDVKAPPPVIVAPASMYELATGEAVLGRQDGSHLYWWLLAVGLLVPPVACVAGYRLWR